jgi:ubiquinone/menaquinone biosynthesis C-methylase UbiE
MLMSSDNTVRSGWFALGYDLFMRPLEWLGLGAQRREMLAALEGSILEVGIGTGVNLPYYGPNVELTGIDISPAMLRRAATRACKLGVRVDLLEMDAEELGFPDAAFDYVISALVFCEVGDPERGLRELARVVKPDGQVILLEHVRSEKPWLGTLMDAANRITAPVGENVNRRTVEYLEASGLELVEVKNRWLDVLKSIRARPSSPAGPRKS